MYWNNKKTVDQDSVVQLLNVFIQHVSAIYLFFCGFETWYLTLREERRLSVFEYKVSRKIFGRNRDKVMGEFRKLLKEELDDHYCSPNITL